MRDGFGVANGTIAHRVGSYKKPSTSMSSPSAANGSQAQYVTCPLRFICREAQVALSDSTPQTAITPK